MASKPRHHSHNRRAYDNLVFGRQPVLELLKGDKQVDQVLLQSGTSGDVIRDIKVNAAKGKVPLKYAPVEKLNRLTGGNHQGVIAFTSPVVFQQWEDIVPHTMEQGRSPLLVVLDHITDVGNFGAICRTAYAAGADAVVIPVSGSAPVNGDAIKSSAGALEHLPVCRVPNIATALQEMKLHGLSVLGTSLKAEKLLGDTQLDLPVAIVMGSEDSGLSPDVEETLDHGIRIPMAREFDSYNVSVACAMVLYEALRQRM